MSSDGVIAVFMVYPQQWSAHDWGAMKVDFVLRNVQAVSVELARLNIPLFVVRDTTFDGTPDVLVQLATQHHCGAVFLNKEYEVNELARDALVTQSCEANGLQVYSFDDQTIIDVSQLQTRSGGFYTVFTPFKRRWIEHLDNAGCESIAQTPKRQSKLNVEPSDVPISLDEFQGHTRPDLWAAGEKEAHKRLRAFAQERMANYADDRDFPSINGTSTLSPYLAAGVLSPRQCLSAALEANNGRLNGSNKGVTTWISELIWREFYRHVLIGYPRVCKNQPFKLETGSVQWCEDESSSDAWCSGNTGVPIVDAGMRQLNQTGWMHNRVRMIVAMFLCKDLFIDWRWGERYFMNMLVDGDFASNNGGWQWSASTGTDAAPYFRIFNPFTQAKRFDPDAEYIRRFIPELSAVDTKVIHDPRRTTPLGEYPAPIVDHNVARHHAIAAFKSLPKSPTRN